jgi:hypothetical protein
MSGELKAYSICKENGTGNQLNRDGCFKFPKQCVWVERSFKTAQPFCRSRSEFVIYSRGRAQGGQRRLDQLVAQYRQDEQQAQAQARARARQQQHQQQQQVEEPEEF